MERPKSGIIMKSALISGASALALLVASTSAFAADAVPPAFAQLLNSRQDQISYIDVSAAPNVEAGNGHGYPGQPLGLERPHGQAHIPAGAEGPRTGP